MSDFPTVKTTAVDLVTPILAKHINNLEDKVGINNSADVNSLDYKLTNPASDNPGHTHDTTDDHGHLTGLTDDDHPQYIRHALATDAGDFLAASGAGAFVKKTLAETKTLLGIAGAGESDHGGLLGLTDDDHPQYILHSLAIAENDFLVASGVGAFIKKTLAQVKTILGLGTAAYTAATDYLTHALATAANDFLVASGSGAFVKKTLAEVKTILGLGTAAYTAATDYAVSAKGVTNGDSHNHVGGDGGQIEHSDLSGLTDDDHTQYIKHALATAANDFLVASGNGVFVKKTLTEVQTLIVSVPVGTISAYGGTSAPTGYFLCNGDNTINRTTYAALYAIIGTTFGAGVDGNTFKLPDLRQRFPLGKAAAGTGSTLGGTGGVIDHTHSEAAHTHGISAGSGLAAGIEFAATTDSGGGAGTGTNNPPFQAVNFIIKY